MSKLPFHEQLQIAMKLAARIEANCIVALIDLPDGSGLTLEPEVMIDSGGIEVRLRVPVDLVPLKAQIEEIIRSAVIATIPDNPIAADAIVKIKGPKTNP